MHKIWEFYLANCSKLSSQLKLIVDYYCDVYSVVHFSVNCICSKSKMQKKQETLERPSIYLAFCNKLKKSVNKYSKKQKAVEQEDDFQTQVMIFNSSETLQHKFLLNQGFLRC